jgi:hypothetical protein
MIYFTQSRGGGTIGEFTGTVGELLRARTE